MAWKPIDFQGIVSLDTPLINQLNQYLDEKETQLSHVISKSITGPAEESSAPQIPAGIPLRFRLSEAIESFDKKIREGAINKDFLPPINDWNRVKDELDAGLWTFVEILESCVIELFQQLSQISLEHWQPVLLDSVSSVKVLLMQRLEECIWTSRRLESLLRHYRKICISKHQKNSIFEMIWPWQWILDQGIISNLEKTQKYLTFRYKRFTDRFHKYVKLHGKSEESLQKFDGYKTLHFLGFDEQEKYKRIYQLLQLWEVNRVSRSLPKQEIVRTLRNAISPERAFLMFQDYFQLLKKELFQASRIIKQDAGDQQGEEAFKFLLENLETYRLETHTLGATVAKYRDFLLRTDPNPYIRARWGFTEWIVGPEPQQTKALLNFGYEVENLDTLFHHLHQSIVKGKTYLETMKIGQTNSEVQHWIHEMGQPLTSMSVMKGYADKVLNHLKELDELGTFNSYVVQFVSDILSKTMRVDWKYNVLFEIPLFYEIYNIHKGIVGPIEDRQHINRLNKFNLLINQIHEWIKKKSVTRHFQEIEQDMNDIKEYLQDFYANIQRLTGDEALSPAQLKSLLRDMSQQLLEYRFIFGKFFHELRQSEVEERSLRNQFLFVDQYFESIDNKIYAFKKAIESKLQS